jgi:hypothetical protein
MPSALENKTQYVTTGKLNTVNDAAQGGGVANIVGASRCPGALGSVVYLDVNNPTFYDSTIGTLYPGGYQRVHLVSTSTQAAARGRVAYWVDTTSTTVPFDVTGDATDGNQAGVFINVITKGNYGYIQVEGLASVLFTAAITKTTPAKKDLVFCTAGDGTGDVLADATNITSPILRRKLGVAEAIPVSGAIGLVKLYGLGQNQ